MVKVSDNKTFIQILIDEENWKMIDKKLYSKHLHKILKCSDKKQLTDLFSVLEPQIALGYVYKLLAVRGYLKNQLRKKLRDKHFENLIIEAVLEKCEVAGYIDDKREAHGFVEREKRRGQGPRSIQRRLQEKAGASMEVSFSEEEEKVQIESLLEKRFPDLSDLKTKQRAYRFLQRRGFSDHLIREHLNCW